MSRRQADYDRLTAERNEHGSHILPKRREEREVKREILFDLSVEEKRQKRQKRPQDEEVLKLEEMSCSMLPELPADILLSHVFLRLPAKSIARFRCVCKPWRCYLTDPKFLRKHHNHISKFKSPQKHLIMHSSGHFHTFAEEDQEPSHAFPRKFTLLMNPLILFIWGSASGLVALEFHFKKLVIWNPSTGDYKMVPTPMNPPYKHRSIQIIGFGYDSSIDDYKLVRLFSFHRNEVDIYSLKSNSWTKFQQVFPRDINISDMYCPRQGYSVDGFIFWLLENPYQSHRPELILSFDLKEDKFKCLPLPLPLPRDGRMVGGNNIFLQVMRGCLVVLEMSYSTGQVNRWVMRKKEDNNTEWRWVWVGSTMIVPSRTCSLPSYLQPLCPLKNGKLLMFDRAQVSKRLIVYDPDGSLLTDLHINGIDFLNQHILYVETLVSPNAWEG